MLWLSSPERSNNLNFARTAMWWDCRQNNTPHWNIMDSSPQVLVFAKNSMKIFGFRTEPTRLSKRVLPLVDKGLRKFTNEARRIWSRIDHQNQSRISDATHLKKWKKFRSSHFCRDWWWMHAICIPIPSARATILSHFLRKVQDFWIELLKMSNKTICQPAGPPQPPADWKRCRAYMERKKRFCKQWPLILFTF